MTSTALVDEAGQIYGIATTERSRATQLDRATAAPAEERRYATRRRHSVQDRRTAELEAGSAQAGRWIAQENEFRLLSRGADLVWVRIDAFAAIGTTRTTVCRAALTDITNQHKAHEALIASP
jgi:hypothetical protein